jgi:hypothetical protein
MTAIKLSPVFQNAGGFFKRACHPVQIIEIGPERLADYASIPIRVEVKSRLQVELVDGGMGGMLLRQVAVEKPYITP